MRSASAATVRVWRCSGSVVSALATVPVVLGFDAGVHGLQLVERVSWITRPNAHYYLGVDGISLWFVPLTAFITVIAVLAGWKAIEDRLAQYYAAFLILSGLMIGVFCAADGLLFYVFFEATLIPMYLIIGVWGGPRRVYAASSSSCTRCSDRCSCWWPWFTCTRPPVAVSIFAPGSNCRWG